MFAEAITHPLDTTKIRLQLQNTPTFNATPIPSTTNSFLAPQQQSRSITTIANPVYRGTMRTTIGIFREEGVRSMYKGLPPALARQLIKAGMQMSAYSHIREGFARLAGPDVSAKSLPVQYKALAAMTAGSIGQVLANPLDVIKIQLQADGRRVQQGKSARFVGATDVMYTLFRQQGIASFWKGCSPSVGRAALSAGAGLTSYDHIKQTLLARTSLTDTTQTHIMTSAMSSLCSALCGTPPDNIKTRMMAQSPEAPKYRGAVDCLIKTVRSQGIKSLYRGFVPTYLRVGPWQFCFFVSYEQIKKALTGTTL